MRMRCRGGFTLIELIMVIVILAVLSVVAIPRYVDLQSEAKRAAADGTLAAASAACAIHYAEGKMKSSDPDYTHELMDDCDSIKDRMELSGAMIERVSVGAGEIRCAIKLDTGATEEYQFTATPETYESPCKTYKDGANWPKR